MTTELVVTNPVTLGGRTYFRGSVVQSHHLEEASTKHPNHFVRRVVPDLEEPQAPAAAIPLPDHSEEH